MGLNLVKVFKNTSTSIPDLIEYGIEMVETVHGGPHKGYKMDIIFENWATRSRQEYNDAFNKTSVDRMCAFMSGTFHGMWESDACTGSERHKESFRCNQGSMDMVIFVLETQMQIWNFIKAICKRVAVNNTEPDLMEKFDDRYSFSKMLKELSNGFANYDDLFTVS